MSRQRSFVVLLAAAVLVLAVGYLALRPGIAEGVVDHKTVTGVKGSVSSTVVVFTGSGVVVKDGGFEGEFEASAAVSEELAYRLESWYDEVDYVVSVRSGGGTMAYFVSREDFNRVDVGVGIRFSVLRFKAASIRIVKVLE